MLFSPKFYPPEVAPHISDKGVLVASPPPNRSFNENLSTHGNAFLVTLLGFQFSITANSSSFCLLQNEENS